MHSQILSVLKVSSFVQTQDHDVSDDSPIKSVIEADDSNRGSRRRKKKTERAAKAAAEEYAEITEEQENLKVY